MIPSVLQGIQGIRWKYMTNLEDLRNHLHHPKGEVFVIIHLQELTARNLQTFMSWLRFKIRLNFIFIAEMVERACFNLYPLPSQTLVLFQSEGIRIKDAVMRKLMGLDVKSRKMERAPVRSKVMVKKSVMMEKSPTGQAVRFLREGLMQDFSKSGAQIRVVDSGIQEKDFVSLMYQNRHGHWVSVESQVRWAANTNQGYQILGVQFLALNA